MNNWKKTLIIMISCLMVIGVGGCGSSEENPTEQADETDSENISESVPENELAVDSEVAAEEVEENFREYNPEELLDESICYQMTFFDGDSINDMAISEFGKRVFHENVVEEFEASLDSHEKQVGTYTKYIILDGFDANDADVEMQFIEYVELPTTKKSPTYLYCKVNILNSKNVGNPLFADWKNGDEIYMIATGAVGTVPSGEKAVRVTFFVKNYSEADRDKNKSSNNINDTDSVLEEQAESGYTDEELCEYAKQYYCLMNGLEPPIVEVDSVDGDNVTIHLYEDNGENISTWDWYCVSRETGKGTNFMGEEIDLSSLPRD